MLFGFLKKNAGSAKMPVAERRKEPRYTAADEFLVEFKDKSHYIGSSRDISVHGIRFATTRKLRAKEKIVLNFRLPLGFTGVRHFSLNAKVARVYRPSGAARYRIACELLHEDEKTKEILRQLIYWLQHHPK